MRLINYIKWLLFAAMKTDALSCNNTYFLCKGFRFMSDIVALLTMELC
ncbi:MAG: hypothetical protein ACJAY0_001649 [Thalassolituus sp.]|jgi:hypothetical protein